MSGEKSVGGSDDHVAGPDAQSHEEDELGVRSGGNADGVAGPCIRDDAGLDLFDFGAEHKVLRVCHRFNGGKDLGLEGAVLAFQVKERYTHV